MSRISEYSFHRQRNRALVGSSARIWIRSLPFVLLCGGLLSLAACNAQLELGPEQAGRAEARVSLAPGQSAEFGTGNVLRVTFRYIESDSRCPIDVQCVTAGDAAALFRLERGAFVGGTTLHTNEAPRGIVIDDNYAIRLVDVSPQPRSGVPIRASDYRVVVEVSRP
jgi:hypothetical protein